MGVSGDDFLTVCVTRTCITIKLANHNIGEMVYQNRYHINSAAGDALQHN